MRPQRSVSFRIGVSLKFELRAVSMCVAAATNASHRSILEDPDESR